MLLELLNFLLHKQNNKLRKQKNLLKPVALKFEVGSNLFSFFYSVSNMYSCSHCVHVVLWNIFVAH